MNEELNKQKNLDELRKRLYSRDAVQPGLKRHDLTDEKQAVAENWNTAELTPQTTAPTPPQPETIETNTVTVNSTVATDFKPKATHHYRLFVMAGSLLIFFIGASLSAVYLLFGGNQISSDNIGVTVAGPSTLAGGEELGLQIAISNQNTVPIESATLILDYPTGARSANESGRELFEERIPINSVEPGEVKNIPVRVAVFGEEGQQKEVSATIEYRIEGSNGTFYKDANPFSFRISSSPLVLRVKNIEKVVAGQMADVTLEIQSNASNPLSNLLIQAEYPNGFDYEESFPSPVFGENVWLVEELLPEEKIEIVLRGVIRGLTEETFRINFDAGPADSSNQYRMASRLTQAWADFTIERPFIDVDIAINGDTSGDVVLPGGRESSVIVDITNTLNEAVYDMVVEVVPEGNALRSDSIRSNSGFYDSNTGTVRWEVSNNPSFTEVFPGNSRTLAFEIEPVDNLTTSSFDITVNVYARRLGETSAQEQLLGTTEATAKFSSNVFVGGQAGHNSGLFTDTGPLPPRVGQTTTYTVTLVAEAGTNDVTDVVLSTSLPLYVTWLDEYQGTGEVTYNTISKQLEWRAGTIEARNRKELSFQVSITPSVSQIDSSPTLVNKQELRAEDRFTGTVLRAESSAVTIALSTEAGFTSADGKVRQ